MDTYLNGGDLEVDVGGYPRAVYGNEERCQRAALTLSTRKGDFIYDRDFGTDWTGFDMVSSSGEETLIRVREALVGYEDIIVEKAKVTGGGYRSKIEFELDCGEENHTEVYIRAGL